MAVNEDGCHLPKVVIGNSDWRCRLAMVSRVSGGEDGDHWHRVVEVLSEDTRELKYVYNFFEAKISIKHVLLPF